MATDPTLTPKAAAASLKKPGPGSNTSDPVDGEPTPVLTPPPAGSTAGKASDHVSLPKSRFAEMQGMLAAIDRVQMVIEFDLDGTILRANEKFCEAMGYHAGEIQ